MENFHWLLALLYGPYIRAPGTHHPYIRAVHTELYILLESILQLEQRKILRPSNGRLASLTKMAALRPVFHRLPEPNRAWLLVVYFSR